MTKQLREPRSKPCASHNSFPRARNALSRDLFLFLSFVLGAFHYRNLYARACQERATPKILFTMRDCLGVVFFLSRFLSSDLQVASRVASCPSMAFAHRPSQIRVARHMRMTMGNGDGQTWPVMPTQCHAAMYCSSSVRER